MGSVLYGSPVIDMVEGAGSAATDPDAQLMLRFREGEFRAFDLLFEKHKRNIVNFAYRFVRNREVAEELAQDIFLKVYENADGYRVQARFTSWLYRIATNVCLNEIRKPRYRAVHQSLYAVRPDGEETEDIRIESGTEAGPDKVLERQAVARVIKQALDRVPEKQRLAFILNKYQELSYDEVADVLNVSEKAVKSLIHRAKETLAEKLKPWMPELLAK
jgi:RNA polymerase sigma-70 factor (ECF subfamily)